MGNFKNNGRDWRPKGTPELVNVHDFIDPKLSRAVPYGVYDISNNVGWISVGTDPDTASFAVHAIRRWWRAMGKKRYPKAKRLMITADGGGSNGYRVRLWKVELQKLSDEINLPITVCHLPPGTSKWNKIEHRLFSFITINWRGKPLRSYRTIVQLIAATTTDTGLTVRAELDENKYPKGVNVSDAQLATVNLSPHAFHGDWNYMISPNEKIHLAESELTELFMDGPLGLLDVMNLEGNFDEQIITQEVGEKIFAPPGSLPICRSITGNGVRQTCMKLVHTLHWRCMRCRRGRRSSIGRSHPNGTFAIHTSRITAATRSSTLHSQTFTL